MQTDCRSSDCKFPWLVVLLLAPLMCLPICLMLHKSTMTRIIFGTNLLLERTSVQSASEYEVDIYIYIYIYI